MLRGESRLYLGATVAKEERPSVTTRIPQDWFEQIEVICAECGKSRSEVFQEAIAAYLGKHPPHSIPSLSKRVSALERNVKKLTTLIVN